MGKSTKRSNRINVVYSTNSDFNYEEEDDAVETLSPEDQLLYLSIDRKNRKGKEVTLIENFIGTEDDLKELSKLLKNKCGTGGSLKDGQILIQGNFRDKIIDFLNSEGYKTKRKGG